MRTRNWRDHWVFDFFDLAYILAGAIEFIAYWHLGWKGVIGASVAIGIALVAARLVRKRMKRTRSSNQG